MISELLAMPMCPGLCVMGLECLDAFFSLQAQGQVLPQVSTRLGAAAWLVTSSAATRVQHWEPVGVQHRAAVGMLQMPLPVEKWLVLAWGFLPILLGFLSSGSVGPCSVPPLPLAQGPPHCSAFT